VIRFGNSDKVQCRNQQDI